MPERLIRSDARAAGSPGRGRFQTTARLFWPVLAALMATSCARAADTITVPTDGLQSALNNAQPGDTLVLEAGAVYTGNFVLPNKGDPAAYITIQTSAVGSLPRNSRLMIDDTSNLATIVTPNTKPAIDAAPGAHHYRFIGIEVHPASGVYVYDLVRLGNSPAQFSDLPHDFVFDRVYIHGDPDKGSKRGIALNCANATIENSYISDFKSPDQDTQALAGWSGPGPFTITNNYLEAAGENILFGDPQPTIPGIVPSDILVQGNYFFKPLSWRPEDPSYAGTRWSVKNLFELKSAQRVTVAGNVFENCWASSQAGFAIVLTVRTQGGANPTAVIKDVTFRDNLIRHAGHGANILGVDTTGLGLTSNVAFVNNLFVDITGATWAGVPGRLFQIINGAQGIRIEHNTGMADGSIIMADAAPSQGLAVRDNILLAGKYGVVGSGTSSGTSTFKRYFPDFVFERNVIVGANQAAYPAGNQFVSSLSDVGFVDDVAGNLALAAASPFLTEAAGGSAPGADYAKLQPLIDAAMSGTPASATSGDTPARTPARPRGK